MATCVQQPVLPPGRRHRRARAGRGAAALVAGIADTVTGAGVASAQVRAGLSVTVLAALVVLLAGVILLAWVPARCSVRRPAGGGCWQCLRPWRSWSSYCSR